MCEDLSEKLSFTVTVQVEMDVSMRDSEGRWYMAHHYSFKNNNNNKKNCLKNLANFKVIFIT